MSQQRFFTRARELNENATKASYEVATLIAKNCKSFSEGDFIEECVMKMVENICPEKKQEFANICLARNTVARRAEEISSDIKRQLTSKGVDFDFFSIACDESMDLSDTVQLLIFMRGVDDEMNVTEELLDLQSLTDQTRGKDLFVSVSSAIDDIKLPWNKLTGIITDGAPAMAGERSGLATLICNKVIEEGGKAMKLHCIIHQQVLCAKHLKYDHVMKPVAEYEDVVYHNDIRWLSRGSALQRFYSLKKEIGEFLETKEQPMRELSDPIWLADLGFLVDITKHLNVLNTSLQGKDAAENQLYSHLKAFGTKLQLFIRQLSQTQPNLINFSALQEIMNSFPQDNIRAQMSKYAAVITSLAGKFKWRFQDFVAIKNEISLFSSPFSVAPDQLQLELIELHCDSELRSHHQQLSLVNFYRQLDKSRFQEIRTLKKMLSLFGSTYMCEQTFSAMNFNKNRSSKEQNTHSIDRGYSRKCFTQICETTKNKNCLNYCI
ncbi:general transcription factor II-I repeat domain-containing protein 2-like [Aquarana catesbeiana]|uniref:general transcription factor II-I repeat domain-containing protein 2-like n=1 Tax=Aquarana catesbeiana TaxID=8400 RepID=UPI003CC926BD